jgi:hypothetical protein
MIAALRRRYNDLVTSGVQVGLLVAGVVSETALGWSLALALMAAISLAAWASALKRRRIITDTPTVRLSSAAQGYVEVRGVGHTVPDNPVRSPITGLPCLWYRFKTERRDSDNRWYVEQQGESDASLIVRDGSGEVLVDPDGAEILTVHKETWQRGRTRHTEWKFIAGDNMYVLGDLRTLGGATLTLDFHGDVKALLAEWKRDPAALKARFDQNGDGDIDLDEWENARSAAQKEVHARHRDTRNMPDAHILRAPRDRPYLIANIDPHKLARRYGLWSLFHLVVFLGALGGIPYVWQQLPN